MMGLWELIAMSLVGGLALNLSPCMLSVLPLKILSFIKQGTGKKSETLILGLLYGLGIVVSFIILALITILIKMTGGLILFGSWSLGSSWFNIAVGCIIALLGLRSMGALHWVAARFRSLTGEPLKESGCLCANHGTVGWLNSIKTYTMDQLGKIKAYSGHLYSFLYGALTPMLGSACCGPILASAMGSALLMPNFYVLLAFAIAGIGMALPYVGLSLIPSGTKWLPRPGNWVKWVERVTGALMLATAGWFFYLGFL